MKTTTKTFTGFASLYMCLCFALICQTTYANSANHTPDNICFGDVSIDMIPIGQFPKYGVEVPFNITVTNDGPDPISNVGVIDYIPAGYTFGTNNAGWVPDGDVPGAYSFNVPGPIPSGGSELITINLAVIAAQDSLDWVNAVEIFEFANEIGTMMCDDTDSNLDKIQGNEVGVEDDYFEAEVPVFDLALSKSLMDDGIYKYGDTLLFRVYIHNQGNTPATQVSVRDYIPEGYNYIQDLNTAMGWSNGAMNTPFTTLPNQINTGQTDSVDIRLVLTMQMADGMAWNNYSEIRSAFDDQNINRSNVDSDSTPNQNTLVENMVLPGDPDDDNIDGGGPLQGEDEDDHDPAGPELYDLALEKRQLTALASFSYGEEVEFETTIHNQGNQTASDIEIVDYIPCGFEFIESENIGWTYSEVSRIAHYTFPNDLLPATQATVTIKLTVVQCYDDPALNWANLQEVGSALNLGGQPFDDMDSTLDSIPDNDPFVEPNSSADDQINGAGPCANEDEDDQDVQMIQIVDLALIKTLDDPSKADFGDTVRFNIQVINQGNVVLDSIRVRDYLPAGYTFAQDINTPWVPNVFGNPEILIPQMLFPEDEATVSIDLILTPANVERDYYNYAEIILAQDTTNNFNNNRFDDADSFVGTNNAQERSVIPGGPDDDNIFGDGFDGEDNDDHDVAGVIFYDLALDKTRTSEDADFLYGNDVEYTITIENEATIPANNITVTDYIPCGFDFDPLKNLDWVYDELAGTASIDINETITPGGSVQRIIILTLEPCENQDREAYNNEAEITVDDGDDDDSTPNSGPDPDEDDNDDEPEEVYDLALSKTLQGSATEYYVGETVVFTMSVTNEGNRDASDVNIIDYVPCGLSSAGITNLGWNNTIGSDNLTYNIPFLAIGQTVDVDISFVIQGCNTFNIENYRNKAEITDFDQEDDSPGNDIDSEPDNISNNDAPNEDDFDDEVVPIASNGIIGGDVWKDLDFDGIHDTSEPSIAGMSVDLIDCNTNTVINSTTSGSTGFYVFVDVQPGSYRVQFNLESLDEPCVFTTPNVGNNDSIDSDAYNDGSTDCIELEANDESYDTDAGLVEQQGSIGDYVFLDDDGDGIQDPNEDGIDGVIVQLYTAGGLLIATTITDSNGFYTFSDLPSNDYYILFDAIEDLFPTIPDNTLDELDSDITGANGDNTTDVFYLPPGAQLSDIDGGFYECATICGYAWLDLMDENEIRDPLENGINGLKVILYKQNLGQWEKIDQQYTGLNPDTPSDDGYFNFCVAPGRYYVQYEAPEQGLVLVNPFVGSDPTRDSDVTGTYGQGTTQAFTIASAGFKCDIGAGYTLMFQVGNSVWIDENLNGVKEPFELPASDVIVQAYNLAGEMVAQAITNEEGIYNIDYLQKTDYYLKFTPPSGMTFTSPNMGDDDLDSDVDGSYGPNTTNSFKGKSGEMDVTMDAGLSFGVLPVEWVNISATDFADHNLIRWSTASELNNEGYTVERTEDLNKGFLPIGKVAPVEKNSNVNHYDYQDYDIESSRYYYRILQSDIDGKESYSEIVVVDRQEKREHNTYPNPTTSEISIRIDGEISEDQIKVILYDNTGSRINNIIYSIESNTISMNLEQYASGIYIIEISDQDKVIIQDKIIKID